jgi:hypothetical protein
VSADAAALGWTRGVLRRALVREWLWAQAVVGTEVGGCLFFVGMERPSATTLGAKGRVGREVARVAWSGEVGSRMVKPLGRLRVRGASFALWHGDRASTQAGG